VSIYRDGKYSPDHMFRMRERIRYRVRKELPVLFVWHCLVFSKTPLERSGLGEKESCKDGNRSEG
jgi:hypothetical protein